MLKPSKELLIFEIVWIDYACNKIIKAFLDGTIWNLDIEGFRSKLNKLGDQFGFNLSDFQVTKREFTYLGILGMQDVIAKLEKI